LSHFGLIEKWQICCSYLTWSVKICKRALHQILIICSNGIALDIWYIVRFWICYANIFYDLFCPKILFEEWDKETCICVNGAFWELGCIIIIQTNWVNIDFLSKLI
jgi:hypothetical protein